MGLELLLVTVALLQIGCVLSEHCTESPSPESDVDFSLYTYRNKTGHIVSQVQLEHEDRSLSEKKGHWQVDIQQKSNVCDGVKTVKITATISGPPEGSSEVKAEPALEKLTPVPEKVAPPAEKVPPPPAPGYTLNPSLGSYYKFHGTGKTWDEARKICQAEGTHLAVINSEAEYAFLRSFLTGSHRIVGATHPEQASIGFHDRFIVGEYVTILGTTIAQAGFSRWLASNPSGGNEHCGSVHINGGINDVPCNSLTFPFFCEKEKPC